MRGRPKPLPVPTEPHRDQATSRGVGIGGQVFTGWEVEAQLGGRAGPHC